MRRDDAGGIRTPPSETNLKQQAMRYLERRPGPALCSWVDKLWYLSDAPQHARERILPSGTHELVINLAEDEFRIYDSVASERCLRFSGAMVSGTYARAFVIDTREHASVLGVHFRPGGARPFFGLPARSLANAHVDLEALWGRAARLLREQLCTARSADQRFDLLEAALGRQLSRFRPHAALELILRQLELGAGVAEIAGGLALSHRRLIELFADDVGMTPKLFSRVLRFQRAIESSSDGAPAWAELAASAGYSDQSHLIRDWRAFSGLSPSEWASDRAVAVKEHHVAAPGAEKSG
jgi:AraC-like DNA-binding protein